MSYCRWSSDNMRSDVYAYEDVLKACEAYLVCHKGAGKGVFTRCLTRAFITKGKQ